MKKFLSLMLMSLVFTTMMATEATFDFVSDEGLEALGIAKPEKGKGTDLEGEYVIEDVTMTFTNGGTATRVWNSQNVCDLRLYANGGSLTFTVPKGMSISNIEFTSANNSIGNLTPSTGKFTSDTWTGSAQSVTFTATATTRINTIVITYGDASLVAPTISFNPTTAYVGEEVEVTITSPTEDADIFYAIGDADYQAYSDPFTITEDVTINAYATKNNERSSTTTKSFTFTPITTVANIAELTKLADKTEFRMTGQATVVYVNGNYLYIKDETGYTLIFKSTAQGIAAGNTLYNLVGKVAIFNSLFEVGEGATYNFDPTTTEVEPLEYALSEITSEKMNQYVIVKGVNLSELSGNSNKDFTMTQDNATLAGFLRFDEAVYPNDLEATYDIVGLVSVYKQQVQIYPISITETQEVVEYAFYFTPEPGEYEQAQTVMVTVDPELGDDMKLQYNFMPYTENGAPRRTDGELTWSDYDDTKGILIEKSGLLTVIIVDVTGEMLGGEEVEYTITGSQTGIDALTTGKAVTSVRYYNVAGMSSDKAFDGMNIVVITHADGTVNTMKMVK